MIHPVVLAGGTGSRLWPLSRALLPKQLLPLVSERTMLQETLLRVQGIAGARAPIVLSNEAHRFLVAEQARELKIELASHVLEPIARSTAPAVAVAALLALRGDPEAQLLVLPADLLIRDIAGFHASVKIASRLADAGKLVTFGIVPTEPATGFGYIRRGSAIDGADGQFLVAAFVEKPDSARAQSFIETGDYYWNSGMFVFQANRYLAELGKFRPDILSAANSAFEKAPSDLDFLCLDKTDFSRCPLESIDRAVMEKTADAAVVGALFDWSDVGSWTTLWRESSKDSNGNVLRGDVYVDRSRDCYVRSEGRLVAAVGVDHLIIVETDDAVLVVHKDHAQEVKQTVERLSASSRGEHISHRRAYRPWGYYETVDSGERFQVKRLMVKPGARLSLQIHRHRAEHWVVVSGVASVVRGEQTMELSENQSTYIPPGVAHRLGNCGSVPLHLVEVQSGTYLGEDDIVRLEDDYRRI